MRDSRGENGLTCLIMLMMSAPFILGLIALVVFGK
jgi:hypothetical protein